MNIGKESFRHDLHRDPGELEGEADRAREHLEHTLEALERRLSPGELLDQVLRTVRGNGSEFGHNLATQVRNNPVPVLLTGVGLTWLLSSSNRPPSPAAVSSSDGVMNRAANAAGSARQAASTTAATSRSVAAGARDKAEAAREGASQAAHRTAETGRRTAAATAERARQMSSAARSGADSVYRGYDYLRQEQPLVLGALAVAAGALIGALIPSSRAEDRAMGEYRDRAVGELGGEVKRGAEQAGRVAADVATSAAESARETVRSGGAVERKGPASTGSTSSGASRRGGGVPGTGGDSGSGTGGAGSTPDGNPGLP